MASVVIAALVNKIVDITADLALKGVTRLVWLKEDIHWLEQQMRYIQAFLHDVERKQVANATVANLIIDIKDLAFDIEDILDTYVPRIESCIPRFLLRIRVCKEIEKIKRRLQAIKDDKEFYGIDMSSAVDTINVDPRIRALHVDEPIVLGFDDDIRKLKVKMLSEEQQLCYVAIVGMPGIGKTTLAKKLFKGVKNKFDYSASVSVSQKPNTKEILLDIAKQLGLEKDEREENVAANIHAFLKERSRQVNRGVTLSLPSVVKGSFSMVSHHRTTMAITPILAQRNVKKGARLMEMSMSFLASYYGYIYFVF